MVIDKIQRAKLILGVMVVIFLVIWYNQVIKLWLIDLNISQKLQELIGALIATVVFYVSAINSTFSQSIRDAIRNIHNSLTISDLVGILLGITLFIYAGMKSYGVKSEVEIKGVRSLL